MLLDDQGELLAAPEASFQEEVERILRSLDVPDEILNPPTFEISGPNESYIDRTSYLEYTQVREALFEGYSDYDENRTGILEQYIAIRADLSRYVKAKDAGKVISSSEEYFKSLVIPEQIPAEHSRYLKGAIAYHLGDISQAREEWLHFFDLPENQRPRRTAWAAYMLGKICIDSTPEEAVKWFDEARRHILESGRDELGLFVASCGLEAPIHYDAGRYAKALYFYALYAAGGGKYANNSLKLSVLHLIGGGNLDELEWAALNPTTQQLVTAYLVSRPYQSVRSYPWAFGEEEESPKGLNDRVQGWLDILERLNAAKIYGADRLALSSYQIGRMDLADRWLSLASLDSLLAKWVRSKLFLREGKLLEAESLLAEIAKAKREEKIWRDWHDAYYFWEDGSNDSDRVSGELAILLLNRGEWIESLDAFLKGNYWIDAAYVAERVLTIDELRSYVDKSFPDGIGEVPQQIRYLLARRLARQDVWIGTADYYPPEIRTSFEEYIRDLRISKNLHNTSTRRARALMEAARLSRHQGMEMFGTEIEPDWTVFQGQYSPLATSLVRAAQVQYKPYRYSSWSNEDWEIEPFTFFDPFRAKERSRVRDHSPFPDVRFHYRYRASCLGWEAAEISPDDDELTARYLWEAGKWGAPRGAHFSDHFYKALVNRNPNIPLAREADRIRGFPKTDEEGNPVIAKLPPETESDDFAMENSEEPEATHLEDLEAEEDMGKPKKPSTEGIISNPTSRDWTALNWHDDLAAATKEALAQNKPILIDFTTDWCGWCRKLEQDTYSDPKIWNALDRDFVLLQFDGDKERDLVKRFNVTGYPALFLTNASGTVLSKPGGYLGPDDFQNQVVNIARIVPQIEDYEKAVQSGDEDAREPLAEKLRESLPHNAKFLNGLAWDLVTERRIYFQAAVVLAEKAVELAPGDHEILDTLARSELTVGLYDRSVEHYSEIAKDQGGIWDLWLGLALVARSGPGDADQAIEALKRYCASEILAKNLKG